MPTPPEHLQAPNDGHVPWLLRRIWDRINEENQHFMGAIVGEEGSGKSHTALKIASNVDPSFEHDRVIFQISELLKTLQHGDHDPGNFYLLDEAGVQLGNRTWQERGQILANQALQLVRNHNLGLIFTLPRLSELDSQAQGRLQAFFEIVEKSHGEYVRGKWKFMDPDRTDTTGKIYKKFPRRKSNGQKIRITSLAFSPPPAELTEPYEEKKTEFQAQFYEKTVGELEESEEEDEQDGTDPQKIAARLADNGLGEIVSRHNQTNQPYINKDLLRTKHDLTNSDARAVKSLLEEQLSTDELEAVA